MIKNVGLIVAKIADGVLSKMRVIEGEHFQIGKPVEIEHFFEAANFISADIEVIQFY